MTKKVARTWISELADAERASLNELSRAGCLFWVSEHLAAGPRVTIMQGGRLLAEVIAQDLPTAFREACLQTRRALYSPLIGQP